MTSSTTLTIDQKSDDDEALRECVGRIVPNMPGGPSAVAEVRREQMDHGGSYDVFIVTAVLDDGSERRFFMKDLGVCRFDKTAVEEKREREAITYAKILADADLGTPAYYGTVRQKGRFWLFLELVEGRRLEEGRVEDWVALAAWVGHAHGFSAQHADRLMGCDFLLRQDAPFFWKAAQKAERHVGYISAALGERVTRLLGCYGRAVDVMLAQPQSALVHGALRHFNVLLAADADGRRRMCPVDWERATLGSPLFDLAYFSDILAPPDVQRVVTAYRDAASAAGAQLPGTRELKYVFNCFLLYRNLRRLWRCAYKQKESELAAIVERSERCAERV